MWPLDQRNKIANNVRFFETGGLEKVGDIDKAATILQYALEGRLTACHLLQILMMMMVSVMNMNINFTLW